MENLAAVIVRLKKELQQVRNTRDRIERVGMSAGFGGNSFVQTNYDLILRRITQLERDLFRAESLADGSDLDPASRVSAVSQY